MINTKVWQGSTNLIFAFTDFTTRKMVLNYAELRVHETVIVGANLHHLIYNMLIDIVFPICFAIS